MGFLGNLFPASYSINQVKTETYNFIKVYCRPIMYDTDWRWNIVINMRMQKDEKNNPNLFSKCRRNLVVVLLWLPHCWLCWPPSSWARARASTPRTRPSPSWSSAQLRAVWTLHLRKKVELKLNSELIRFKLIRTDTTTWLKSDSFYEI